MLLRTIYDESLAQAAYLIGCQATGEAIIFDPERDVDRYTDLAAEHGMTIVASAETHIHADFLSGARQLAEAINAKVFVSDEGDANWKYGWLHDRQGGGSYEHQLLKDGDTFQVGNIQFRAVHTPGHTPEHLSYEVTDLGGGASGPMGIVTGDFVFVGDLGRPDLLETATGFKGTKEAGARALGESARSFLDLPEHWQVWPAHGSGSACGKALGAVPQSTVGYEKRYNAALKVAPNEKAFVEFILSGQPDPPYYFARMKKDNRDGVSLLGGVPVPEHFSAEQLTTIDTKAVAVIDTREWDTFRRGHLAGSLKPLGGVGFLASVGSFVTADEDIVLIVERDRLDEVIRQLIRIGLDRVIGWASPATLSVALETIDGGDMIDEVAPGDVPAMRDAGAAMLDVRTTSECAEGMIAGAISIPYTRLIPRFAEVPEGEPIIVNCKSGGRSAAACTMLARAGRTVVNLEGGYHAWLAALDAQSASTPQATS
ncbi:MAG: MBL fold metallo-hydrolase [Phycisphaerae bacterium]|nr:MBL fold metallo-hydrolase [Phycisphaerae bacterium]